MKKAIRILVTIAVVAPLIAPVVAEPPPKLHNFGQFVEERAPVRLPGTVRRADGGDGGGGGGVGFAINAAVAQRTQPGPMDLTANGLRTRGPLMSGSSSAVYSDREQGTREIRRLIRRLN